MDACFREEHNKIQVQRIQHRNCLLFLVSPVSEGRAGSIKHFNEQKVLFLSF